MKQHPNIEILTVEEADQRFGLWKNNKLWGYVGEHVVYCKTNMEVKCCNLSNICDEGLEEYEISCDDWDIGAMIVDGNLTVKNFIKDEDVNGAFQLYVTGNIEADSLFTTSSEIYVEGNLTAKQLVWVTSEHGHLYVFGNLDTPLIIVDKHCTDVRGAINIKNAIIRYPLGNTKFPNQVKDYSEVLVPIVLEKVEDNEWKIDNDALYNALSERINVQKDLSK